MAPFLLGPVHEGPKLMTALVTPLFWNQKLKIAILTLATFAALC
jgi:hypothetical protein